MTSRLSMMSNRHKAAHSGSALVLTLLIVTVMSIIVAAFMQSVSVERMTSKSYANIAKAEMAAEAGIKFAQAYLLRAFDSAKGTDLVYRKGNYFYLLSPFTDSSGNPQYKYIPLFTNATYLDQAPSSTHPALEPSAQHPFLALVDTPNDPASQPLTETPVVASAQTSGIKPWNSNSASVPLGVIGIASDDPRVAVPAGFAFWIEDYQGRVNTAFAGNGTTHIRLGKDDPKEIALFTLFNKAALTQTSSNPATNFIAKRDANPAAVLFSPQSYLSYFASEPNYATLQDITVALPFSYKAPLSIPEGFGYADAGKPKFNLNNIVQAASSNQTKAVDDMAKVIGDNLPNFASTRRGGFSAATKDYNKTLAAAAIDYADSDSTPTVGASYRGVDGAPFVNIVYTKYEWLQKNVLISAPPAMPAYKLVVKATTFVQVWNMSNQNISGTFTFEDDNKDDIVEAGYPFGITTNSTALAMSPNEVRLLAFEKTHDVATGPATISGNKVTLVSTNTSTSRFDYKFTVKWNGVAYDGNGSAHHSGAERPAKTLDFVGTGAPDWTGHLPSLRYENYTTNLADQQLGDPRATWGISTKRIAANNYKERTSWWGMATMRPNPNRYLAQPETWPDSVSNLAAPASGASLAARPWPDPTASTNLNEYHHITDLNGYKSNAVPLDSRNSPTFLSNSGVYQSACDLGNVFDPAQWKFDRALAFQEGHPVGGISSNATASADYGGGFTLRVGRPEHNKFDIPGSRAAQLLDLFEAGTDPSKPTVATTRAHGKINVNTAGDDVLRTLIAGVQITSDPAAGNGTYTLPTPATGEAVGKAFVDAVRKRLNDDGPIFSTAELAHLRDPADSTPDPTLPRRVFGDNRLWPNASRPTATLRDNAQEELFRKVWPHITTTSRAFRLVVVGHALDSTGRKISTAKKEYTLVFDFDESTSTHKALVYNETIIQ